MILGQLLIGAMAIAVSVIIHASFMLAAASIPQRADPSRHPQAIKALIIIGVVVWFFLSICVQCWAWAVLLMYLGAMESLEAALYFSTVTFTTVGYGDLVLGEDWRLLGSFAGANGTIIIGWTTAMVFLAVQRIYP
ncbi:potassium channel family protein [Futiania mangrovi]|uniref:Potassium channel family protein n=1 Tax=Futiania mangrovi TaxID=2959716 RepID=A0A9J6PEH3_9PROT|nr:ion channel [Futiania mangrovii]MCP1337821.1 potassium channel family protein [Futiania mangrovii]